MIELTSKRVQSADDRRNLVIPGEESFFLQYCAEHFLTLHEKAIRSHGYFSVALSGGSTPKKIFEILSSSPLKEKIAWDKLYLFWSDERAVLPTDEKSNYKMAMNAGFKNMPLLNKNIFRMHAENHLKENAQVYEKKIIEVLDNKPIDLVMLGVGEDGHCASLFPDSEGLKEQKKLVIPNYIPSKKEWRMTLSFPGIHHSHHIVFYASGEGKKEILQKIFFPEEGSLSYPAQLVGKNKNKALWIIDKAASLGLAKKLR